MLPPASLPSAEAPSHSVIFLSPILFLSLSLSCSFESPPPVDSAMHHNWDFASWSLYLRDRVEGYFDRDLLEKRLVLLDDISNLRQGQFLELLPLVEFDVVGVHAEGLEGVRAASFRLLHVVDHVDEAAVEFLRVCAGIELLVGGISTRVTRDI